MARQFTLTKEDVDTDDKETTMELTEENVVWLLSQYEKVRLLEEMLQAETEGADRLFQAVTQFAGVESDLPDRTTGVIEVAEKGVHRLKVARWAIRELDIDGATAALSEADNALGVFDLEPWPQTVRELAVVCDDTTFRSIRRRIRAIEDVHARSNAVLTAFGERGLDPHVEAEPEGELPW